MKKMAAPGKRSGAALKLEPLRKKRKLLEVVGKYHITYVSTCIYA